jgi:hypothetical protein
MNTKLSKKTAAWSLYQVLGLVMILSMLFAAPLAVMAWTDYAPGSVVTIMGDNRDGKNLYYPGMNVLVKVYGPEPTNPEKEPYYAECSALVDEYSEWFCTVTLSTDIEIAIGEYDYDVYNAATNEYLESGTFYDGLHIDPKQIYLQPGDTQTFTGLYGVEPYTYSIFVNQSGGTIDPVTGLYTAGPGGLGTDLIDTVRVTDDTGETADAFVYLGDLGNGEQLIGPCMQDLYGSKLNCTANDVDIAKVENVTIIDDGCAFPGDTVTFTGDFYVELTAQNMYDIGLYFSVDGDPQGDGAYTGTCSISTLPYSPTPPFVDLDGLVGGIQDTCGDINAANSPIILPITLTAPCIDTNGDGYLNLPYAVSWRIAGQNDLCTSPLDAIPATSSKCNSDDGFSVPIPVPGQIIVDKVTDPTGSTETFGFNLSGSYDSPDDGITPPGTVNINFTLKDQDPPWESASLWAGTYAVTEGTIPYGWELDSASCVSDQRMGSINPSSIDLHPGETITCTFNNKQLLGWLKLVKTVTNDDGGTLLKTNFQAYIDDVAKDWDTSYEYIAGEYDIREATQTGYTASAWTGTNCSGGATTGTAIVLPGQTTTCYITNDDIAPTLKLVKAVTKDDGGDAVPNDWTLYATAAEPKDGRNFSNLGGSGVFKTVYANVAYTLTESTVAGYTAGNWVCTGGNLVGNVLTLGLDVNVTCTITNDDIAPTLKLVKSVINNDGGTAVPNDWTLYATAAEPKDGRNFSNLGGSGVFKTVYANVAYTLTESTVPGYAQGTWICSGGNLVGNVLTLSEGQTGITCTITNDDIAPKLKTG